MLDESAGLHGNFRLCDDAGRDFDCSFTAMDYVDGQARYAGLRCAGKYGRTIPPTDDSRGRPSL